MTPHPGEFARLTGAPAQALQADRVALARKAAAEFGSILLLKGSRTVVAEPDGQGFRELKVLFLQVVPNQQVVQQVLQPGQQVVLQMDSPEC